MAFKDSPAPEPSIELLQRSLQRGNIAYLFGKYCELRGQNDEAKWWYRTSLQTRNVHFGCRPMAASALRHLGEEYFK